MFNARFLDYHSDVIRPLSEERAVELGANFIGETILFVVAAVTIVGEMYRTSRNNQTHKENVQETLTNLQKTLQETLHEQERLQKRLDELEARYGVR